MTLRARHIEALHEKLFPGGSDMSSILGSVFSAPFPQTSNQPSNQFDDVSELDLQQITSESGTASVSLGANLSGTSAATSTGKLALAFANAIDASTSVDAATGQRELNAGAAGKLSDAVTNLLMQNGFSASQAASAVSNLQNELSNGAPLSLSLSFDNTSSSSTSAAGAYGSNVSWSAESVTQTEQSGSLNISLDASGTLNVSLKEQSITSAHYEGEVKGTGSMDTPMVTVLATPGAGGANSAALGAGARARRQCGQLQARRCTLGFDTATQAALAQLQQIMPDVFKNGFGTPSANSPVSESETDTVMQTEMTAVSLTNTMSAGNADGSTGSGMDGGQDGNGAQLLSSGQTTGGRPAPARAARLVRRIRVRRSRRPSPRPSRAWMIRSRTCLPNCRRRRSSPARIRRASSRKCSRPWIRPRRTRRTVRMAPQTRPMRMWRMGTTRRVRRARAAPRARRFPVRAGRRLAARTACRSISASRRRISIQIVDSSGHGSTLFARPDGSLGSMVSKPTHVTVCERRAARRFARGRRVDNWG